MNEEPNPKKQAKKKPQAKSKPSKPDGGRTRSKTAVFEKGKGQEGGNKKVEVSGIGKDRFKNLLSMFDKKEDDQPKDNQAPQRGKLNMNRFNSSQEGDPQQKRSAVEISSGGLSVKERMAALMQQGQNKTTKRTSMDPILEERKKMLEEQGDEDDDEDDLDLEDDEEDLVLEDNDKEEDALSLGGPEGEKPVEKKPKDDNKDIDLDLDISLGEEKNEEKSDGPKQEENKSNENENQKENEKKEEVPAIQEVTDEIKENLESVDEKEALNENNHGSQLNQPNASESANPNTEISEAEVKGDEITLNLQETLVQSQGLADTNIGNDN